MEWIQQHPALTTFVVGLLPLIIAFTLPRKKTVAYGRKVGIVLSKIFRQRLGKPMENRLETTIIDFMDGVEVGLKEDNDKKVNGNAGYIK
jgi:hypothetical protein